MTLDLNSKMQIGQTGYFTSYEDLEIHKLMLEDSIRTSAYKKAILSNKSYFQGKTVMDVGCGTGILSIFLAQAGAKKVYAVEASNVADIAKEVVKENGFENIIEVIQSKVEDVTLPGVKVDAIVSEWMGFYLLHEGMLDSVLIARDKFLKEDGHMFPESATLYVAPCSVPTLYEKWNNIHGVKLSTFAKHLRQMKHQKPEISIIEPEDLLGLEVAFCWINLKEDKPTDLDVFSIEHVVAANRKAYYQGIGVWFECVFPFLSNEKNETKVILGTGPFNMPTHWKQTVIVLPEEQLVEENEPIAFQLDMKRDTENPRRYTLQLTLLDPEVVEHPMPCLCHMTKCIIVKTFMQQHPEQKKDDNMVLENCDVDSDGDS